MFSKDCFSLLVRATTTIEKNDKLLNETTTVRNKISYEKAWHENGRKYYKGVRKNGKLCMLVQQWYDNGQKWFECPWKNGLKEGLEQMWYENGQQVYECVYKNGKIERADYSWWSLEK